MQIEEDELVNLLFWGSFFIASIGIVSVSDRILFERIKNILQSRKYISKEDCGVTGLPRWQPGEDPGAAQAEIRMKLCYGEDKCLTKGSN